MCAIEAGKRNRSVLVIEHAEKIGKKILISGGGRCNFTNKYAKYENFISQNLHFCKSALAGYTADDFISLVQQHKISFHEKKLGQLFCDGSSRQIVTLFENECSNANVRIVTDCKVIGITKSEHFEIITLNEKIVCESLVIATGGISIPKMGATDFGYKIAKQFDLNITDVNPGLVPFTLHDNERKVFSVLSGISVDTIVSCNKKSFRENMLFTHGGLSGPSILQISSYWEKGYDIAVILISDENLCEILLTNNNSKTELVNFISNYFPKRFADIFCNFHFKSKPLNQYSQKDLKKILEIFLYWVITPSGLKGFQARGYGRGCRYI